MSKLEKARDRLIELRDQAIAGPWTVTESLNGQSEINTPVTDNGKTFPYPIVEAGDYASSNATFDKDTAALIVTLYATIDAQIAVLDHAILADGIDDTRAAKTLAKAILKATS